MEFKIPADTAMMAFYLHRIYNFNLSRTHCGRAAVLIASTHSTSDSGEDNDGGHWADTTNTISSVPRHHHWPPLGHTRDTNGISRHMNTVSSVPRHQHCDNWRPLGTRHSATGANQAIIVSSLPDHYSWNIQAAGTRTTSAGTFEYILM